MGKSRVNYTTYCATIIYTVCGSNMLDLLTNFSRTQLADILDKVVLRFQVNPGFDKLTRAFDKMFSLTINYTKGWEELFW